jgi:hypothetical protein
MLSLVLLGGFGAVILSTRFLEKGIDQVYGSPARLVRADLNEILIMGQALTELVILRLGHPLQEALHLFPLGVRPHRRQALGLLRGEAVGQQRGR